VDGSGPSKHMIMYTRVQPYHN